MGCHVAKQQSIQIINTNFEDPESIEDIEIEHAIYVHDIQLSPMVHQSKLNFKEYLEHFMIPKTSLKSQRDLDNITKKTVRFNV